jgi:hypothetical protein
VEHYVGKGPIPRYCEVRNDGYAYVTYGTGEEELYDLAAAAALAGPFGPVGPMDKGGLAGWRESSEPFDFGRFDPASLRASGTPQWLGGAAGMAKRRPGPARADRGRIDGASTGTIPGPADRPAPDGARFRSGAWSARSKSQREHAAGRWHERARRLVPHP